MEFRCPDILDADPVLHPTDAAAMTDLQARLERMEAILQNTRDYGRTLWSQLDETRRYLLEEVAGGEDGRQRAMLSDPDAWQAWIDLFGRVSSALAGTAGDSGFGRSEATLIARTHGVEVGRTRG